VLRVGSLSPAEELVGATDNKKKITIVRAIGKALCAVFIYAPPFELGNNRKWLRRDSVPSRTSNPCP